MCRDAICGTRSIIPDLAIGKSDNIINLLKGPLLGVYKLYFCRILFGSCSSYVKSPGTLRLLGGGKNILLLWPPFLYFMLRLFQEGNKGHVFHLPFFFDCYTSLHAYLSRIKRPNFFSSLPYHHTQGRIYCKNRKQENSKSNQHS